VYWPQCTGPVRGLGDEEPRCDRPQGRREEVPRTASTVHRSQMLCTFQPRVLQAWELRDEARHHLPAVPS